MASISAVNEAFDRIDTNHDGVISREEFAAAALKGGGAGGAGEGGAGAEIAEPDLVAELEAAERGPPKDDSGMADLERQLSAFWAKREADHKAKEALQREASTRQRGASTARKNAFWASCAEGLGVTKNIVDNDALRKIAAELAAAEGLVGTHTHHLVSSYPDTLVGREAVAWLVAHGHARDRAAAVALGNRLVNAGLMHHVCDEHMFEDAFLFYRLRLEGKPLAAEAPPPSAPPQHGHGNIVKTPSGHLKSQLVHQMSDGLVFVTSAAKKQVSCRGSCLKGEKRAARPSLSKYVERPRSFSTPNARAFATQSTADGVAERARAKDTFATRKHSSKLDFSGHEDQAFSGLSHKLSHHKSHPLL